MKRRRISSRLATEVKNVPHRSIGGFPRRAIAAQENGMALGLRPSDPAVSYSGSADDPRIGQLVRQGPASGGVALIGYADDRAIANGRGRAGAAAGPTEARRFLNRLTPGDRGELDRLPIFDLGDVADSAASIEDLHARTEEAALEALRAGACVVLLGGGHDGAYASHSALLRSLAGRVGAVNVDAHLDVRPLRDGQITSGTPFRRLAERWGSRYGLVEVGIQPQHNARAHRAFCDERGFAIVTLAQARRSGVADAFASALRQPGEALAVSLDLDAVQTASAPGVSAPCPDGLSAAELIACARIAGRDPRVRVLDVMELSPPYDVDGRTARLAAAAVWNFLAGVAKRGP
jgi:formiminoglutamase